MYFLVVLPSKVGCNFVDEAEWRQRTPTSAFVVAEIDPMLGPKGKNMDCSTPLIIEERFNLLELGDRLHVI
jgi:hypothetical protein